MIITVKIEDREYIFRPLSMAGPVLGPGERRLVSTALRVAADMAEWEDD